jgi:hypothetical protein
MNYSVFKVGSDETKVTGIRNGGTQAFFTDEFWHKNPELYDYMWGNGILEFRKGISPKNFSLNLVNVEMHKSAKKTDFISIGAFSMGYVISDNLKKLLGEFTLPPHNYYDVNFKQWDKKTNEWKIIEGYSWLFFQKETGEYNVDFKKCNFDFKYHNKHLGVIESDIKFDSYQDYISFILKTERAPDPKQLFFTDNFNKELDLFGCNFLSFENYISDKLLGAFVKNKITGYRTYSYQRLLEISKINGLIPCELTFE